MVQRFDNAKKNSLIEIRKELSASLVCLGGEVGASKVNHRLLQYGSDGHHDDDDHEDFDDEDEGGHKPAR